MPLCGVPPLRFTLARLKAAGVEEVVVKTHWLPEVIEAVVGNLQSSASPSATATSRPSSAPAAA